MPVWHGPKRRRHAPRSAGRAIGKLGRRSSANNAQVFAEAGRSVLRSVSRMVNKLLDVNRYAPRCHASSVQHPQHTESRWLLHARRVPVLQSPPAAAASRSASQPAVSAEPQRAGTGDPDALVWMCWACLTDICAKKLKLPLNGLTNDNGGGRFRPCLNGASEATKMLASFGHMSHETGPLGQR